MLSIIKHFKNSSFQADTELTHLLYIKRWADNFLFDDEIERDGKKWIED